MVYKPSSQKYPSHVSSLLHSPILLTFPTCPFEYSSLLLPSSDTLSDPTHVLGTRPVTRSRRRRRATSRTLETPSRRHRWLREATATPPQTARGYPSPTSPTRTASCPSVTTCPLPRPSQRLSWRRWLTSRRTLRRTSWEEAAPLPSQETSPEQGTVPSERLLNGPKWSVIIGFATPEEQHCSCSTANISIKFELQIYNCLRL